MLLLLHMQVMSTVAAAVSPARTRTPMAIAFWTAMIILVAFIVVRHLSSGLPHH
jgi:hypothetical protein